MPRGSGDIAARLEINLHRIDLVSLHLVFQCSAHGSISAAAVRCNLSTTGASERLRRLEGALGQPLFHRHKSGLHPTEAGFVATRAAEDVLQRVLQMTSEIKTSLARPPASAENPGRRGKAMQGQP